MTNQRIPRVLSIAGTDPTGGAGIQADLKSIEAAGGFGMSVVTALVAQNTCGVSSVHVPPLDFLREQLDCVADDVTIDAVKIGMLANAEVAGVILHWLRDFRAHSKAPIVLDPVMVATSGDRLLDADAEAIVSEIATLADVVTPNLEELAVLSGCQTATSFDDAVQQARRWAKKGGATVIVKGGHLTGSRADNAAVTPDGQVTRVPSTRVETTTTHGTGCSLSSALATRLARAELSSQSAAGASNSGPDDAIGEALTWTTEWLHEAIANGHELRVGRGNGPVYHAHRMRRLAQVSVATQPACLRLSSFEIAGATAPAPSPRIPAAGPHTQALWDATGDVWEQIRTQQFIVGLGDGTLTKEYFDFYLQQDSLYLTQYSKALARLSAAAPSPRAQVAWARGAAECIEVEAALHRDWLQNSAEEQKAIRAVEEVPSAITSAYTDFLIAATHVQPYVVGVAAVLPCYWLYAEVGLHLASLNRDGHPYAAWLEAYAGQDFLESTKEAIAETERALAAADDAERHAALRAYLTAAWHEVAFFDQAFRREC